MVTFDDGSEFDALADAFAAATGVDKTAVANFRGGYFDKDVSSFLRAGYIRMSGYVGTFPKPVVTRSWVSSNGGYYKYNAKLLSPADLAIYTTSATTKEGFTLANWKRRGEILSMVTPYFFNTIDTNGFAFGGTVAPGKYCTMTESDATPEIDQPLGKVRKVFAVTYTNPGFAITIE